ncbi:MAG: hypothetical protein GY909_10500 [Oligoflexia bacterium]|nr:hypothetical protein [Oligoflexia bacterium]
MIKRSKSTKTSDHTRTSLLNEQGSLAGVGITFSLILLTLLIIQVHQANLIRRENEIRRETYRCYKNLKKLHKTYYKRIEFLNDAILYGKFLTLTPLVKIGRTIISTAKLAQQTLVWGFFRYNFSFKGCNRQYTRFVLKDFPHLTAKLTQQLVRINDLAISRKKSWKLHLFSKSIIKERTFYLRSNVKIEEEKTGKRNISFKTKELNLASNWLSGLAY